MVLIIVGLIAAVSFYVDMSDRRMEATLEKFCNVECKNYSIRYK
jgi:hypothetical protein